MPVLRHVTTVDLHRLSTWDFKRTLDLTALLEGPLLALTMAPHFLEDFPREIRDPIYFHVLVSPTGFVNLVDRGDVNNDPIPGLLQIVPYAKDESLFKLREQPINLSLLRTCKQIHDEAKNVFWEHNGIHLFNPGQLVDNFIRELDVSLSLKIRRIEIDVDVLDGTDLKQISEALKTLGRWSREGKLEEVTLFLVVRNPKQDLARVVESLLNMRYYGRARNRLMYEEYLAVLKEAGGDAGYLAKVTRRIVFNAYWRTGRPGPVWSIDQRGHNMNGFESKNPMPIVKDMHNAFGGEFWVDDLMVFKDHVEVNDLLRRDPLGRLMSPQETRLYD